MLAETHCYTTRRRGSFLISNVVKIYFQDFNVLIVIYISPLQALYLNIDDPASYYILLLEKLKIVYKIILQNYWYGNNMCNLEHVIKMCHTVYYCKMCTL